MVRCFIVRVWIRIPSNNALHEYFSIDMPYNRKVMGYVVWIGCQIKEHSTEGSRPYQLT